MIRPLALLIVTLVMVMARFSFSDANTLAKASSTMSFGFLLLAAYLLGDFLSRFKIPKITGYLVAGICLGPSGTGLVGAETVQELKLIDDLALSFIALAAGGELRLDELRQRRTSIVLTVLFLTVIVFCGVAGFSWVVHPLLPFLAGESRVHVLAVAALLGIFAAARSPSSAIAIIHECRARGPFTETVLGATVLMDVLVIILFAAVVSVCQALVVPGVGFGFQFANTIAMELVGSVLLGVMLGRAVSLYIRTVKAELLVFVLGVAFLVTFLSRQFGHLLDDFYDVSFHLEPMLICVTAGFWIRNFSRSGGPFMEQIDLSSLPIYVIFFALTGAALDVEALDGTWRVAILVVGVRLILVWLGAFLAGYVSGDPPHFRRVAGFGFVTQAGVSLGLAAIVVRRFPDWGEPLATTIVAIIAINQLIGPIAFKFALSSVGEARLKSDRRNPARER